MELSKYFNTITDKNIITIVNPTNEQISNLVEVSKRLDAVREEFGVLIVTSGLRPAKAHNYSQHQDGKAIDFIPKSKEFDRVFDWIRFNMNFDQLILEKDQNGNRWIHFSYSTDKNRQMALYGYWDKRTKQMEYRSV